MSKTVLTEVEVSDPMVAANAVAKLIEEGFFGEGAKVVDREDDEFEFGYFFAYGISDETPEQVALRNKAKENVWFKIQSNDQKLFPAGDFYAGGVMVSLVDGKIILGFDQSGESNKVTEALTKKINDVIKTETIFQSPEVQSILQDSIDHEVHTDRETGKITIKARVSKEFYQGYTDR